MVAPCWGFFPARSYLDRVPRSHHFFSPLSGTFNYRRDSFTEQSITALREAEVGLARGKSVKLISRELGITEQTYYRWRREYGGMKVSQARRLKELERENGRLKRAVADLTLDKLILEEAARGNF